MARVPVINQNPPMIVVHSSAFWSPQIPGEGQNGSSRNLTGSQRTNSHVAERVLYTPSRHVEDYHDCIVRPSISASTPTPDRNRLST